MCSGKAQLSLFEAARGLGITILPPRRLVGALYVSLLQTGRGRLEAEISPPTGGIDTLPPPGGLVGLMVRVSFADRRGRRRRPTMLNRWQAALPCSLRSANRPHP